MAGWQKAIVSSIVLGMVLSALVVNVSAVVISSHPRLTTISASPEENGLVGYWSFDEGSGTTASDSSGNGNNGTVYGAAWTDGVSGKALSFDGVNDYVDVTISNPVLPLGDNSHTIEAWIKPVQNDGSRGVLYYGNIYGGAYSGAVRWLYSDWDGDKGVSCGYYGGEVATYNFPTLNSWTHLAWTYDGTTNKLYVNGVLCGTSTFTANTQSSTKLRIGRAINGAIQYFNGIIDEIEIYSRAKTAAEILADYQAEVPVTNISPIASFTYLPSAPTTADTIQFTDQSTDSDGTIASWSWDFGDGTTSTSQNPTHKYSSVGVYTVSLTVTDNGGATNNTSGFISVASPPVVGPTPTTISISPSTFSINSGAATTLTATLKDNANNPVASRTVSWSATSGSLSTTSGATNSSGQVSVTYTAPSVTAATSVTITASFAGDSSYSSSSGSSSGTVTASMVSTTTLSISPSSFTLSSGETTTLTATLTSSGSLLSGKAITWSASTGTLSASSGTTNSSGQVSVTYTAPTATAQTTVTITASFAGNSSYSSSSGTSTGTVSQVALTSTTVEISPLDFDIASEESADIIAVLFGESYDVVLAGKAVQWSATDGVLVPLDDMTDNQGQARATYTAPAVSRQTAAIITVSFSGDDVYAGSSTISRVIVLLSDVSSALENLQTTMEQMQISVTTLAGALDNLRDAISAGKVGVSVSIEIEDRSPKVSREFQHDVDVSVKEISIGNKVEMEVSSESDSGRTVIINVDNQILPDISNAKVSYDGGEIRLASDYSDILDPTDENVPEYLILTGASGTQVLVSVPHFSAHTITIATASAQPPATSPVLVIAAVAAVAGAAAAGWVVLHRVRGEAASELMEHGLSKMSLEETEIFIRIKGKNKFTLPELMHETGISKTAAWYTVHKLIKQGLVKPTEEFELPAAGRGKPSRVYRYVHEKAAKGDVEPEGSKKVKVSENKW